MALRLFRTSVFATAHIRHAGTQPEPGGPPGQAAPRDRGPELASCPPDQDSTLNDGEIYLINPDVNPDDPIPCTAGHCDPRRLTTNEFLDAFPALSPDGKRIVFDSNRLHLDPWSPSTLGPVPDEGGRQEQTHLTRGSSATWSPDGKQHRVPRLGVGHGAADQRRTRARDRDSDIFVMNVDDCLEDLHLPRGERADQAESHERWGSDDRRRRGLVARWATRSCSRADLKMMATHAIPVLPRST